MIVLTALILAQGSTPTHTRTMPGVSWQVRTLVRGTRTPALRLACVTPGDFGWIEAIVPTALRRDCDLRGTGGVRLDAPCRGGGQLRVAGSLHADRFDLIVRRTGPVGANRAAAVTLHVEGNRIGGCTPPALNP